MRFGDYRTKASAAKMAAHLRNETESAGTIATFGNLDERVVTWGRQHARSRFIVKIGRTLIAEWQHRQRPRVCFWVANAEDVVELARPDEGIDLRHLCFQLIAVTLNQTAGNY